jgi:hypothetical protein
MERKKRGMGVVFILMFTQKGILLLFFFGVLCRRKICLGYLGLRLGREEERSRGRGVREREEGKEREEEE